jgi:hypothetical protein
MEARTMNEETILDRWDRQSSKLIGSLEYLEYLTDVLIKIHRKDETRKACSTAN